MAGYRLIIIKNNASNHELDKLVESIDHACNELAIHGVGSPDKELFSYCWSKAIARLLKTFKYDFPKGFELTIGSGLEISANEARYIVESLLLPEGDTSKSWARVKLDGARVSVEAISILCELKKTLKHCFQSVRFSSCDLDIGQPKDIVCELAETLYSISTLNIETKNCSIVDARFSQGFLQAVKQLESIPNFSIRDITFSHASLSLGGLDALLTSNHVLMFEFCRLLYDTDSNDEADNNSNLENKNKHNNYQSPPPMRLLAGSFTFRPHMDRNRDGYCFIKMSDILHLNVVSIFNVTFGRMVILNINRLTFHNCNIDIATLQDLPKDLLFEQRKGNNLTNLKIRFQHCTILAATDTVQTTIFPTIGYLEWNTSNPESIILAKNIYTKNNNMKKTISSITTAMKLIAGECFPVPIVELTIYAMAMNKSQCQELTHHLTNSNVIKNKLRKVTLNIAGTENLTEIIRNYVNYRNIEVLLNTFEKEFDIDTDVMALAKITSTVQLQKDNKIKLSLVPIDVGEWGLFDDWYGRFFNNQIQFCTSLINIRHEELLQMDFLSPSLFPFIFKKIRRSQCSTIFWILKQFPQIIIDVAQSKQTIICRKRKKMQGNLSNPKD